MRRREMAPLEGLDVPLDVPELNEIAPSASLALVSDAVAGMPKAIPGRSPSFRHADRIVRSIGLNLHRSSKNSYGEGFLDPELLRSEGPKGMLKRDPTWVSSRVMQPSSLWLSSYSTRMGKLPTRVTP